MAAEIIPFAPRPANEPLAYNAGVVPFDRSNLAHIRAWNTLFGLGWAEQRAEQLR